MSVIEKFVRAVSPGANMSILSRELPPGVIEEGGKVFMPVTFVPEMDTVAVPEIRLRAP